MNDEKEFLVDWITRFLENRNVIFRTIEEIAAHDQYDLCVRHKTKEQYVIAQPKFGREIFDKITKEKHIILVGFNSEDNFEFLVENWRQLVTFPNLTIYFINPLSELDKRWVICPFVHQRICDNASLKTGLRAMYETVEPLTEAKIKSLIKQVE
jgi:hypothetical protein